MTSVLSLGSNLGDRMGFLRLGVSVLEPVAVSQVYETRPDGPVEQEDFLNLVALCSWDAAEAWRRAAHAETLAERAREVRWGPRTLDVDVIWASGTDPALVLPHPRAHTRAFVLVPWLELDSEAVLPGYGPVADLVVDTASVRPVGPLA